MSDPCEPWRGVDMLVRSEHPGHVEWKSTDEVWKAVRFTERGVWFARMRIGAHRFNGQGPNARLALDAARESAREVLEALAKALRKLK